ncbi:MULTISPECIES: hypothetical protein [Bacillus]|uniref:hypothetical protein n=1 Tax=Bacillus TaxID=1386 RepID=UPI000279AE7F|nr:hypothetical protein [Bacillus cereus]EJR71375.1 hypothetical protein IK9_06026 [Bacillus cereus VD166]MDZ4454678.1 hypothetical protein [Bacillus cereus]
MSQDKIKLFMDSGKEYEVSMHIEVFLKEVKNHVGIITDQFFKIGENEYINPKHISSIEKIK